MKVDLCDTWIKKNGNKEIERKYKIGDRDNFVVDLFLINTTKFKTCWKFDIL